MAPLGRMESVTAHNLLAQLYERGIGTRANPARAREHRRLYWLLWPYGDSAQPFASDAERDAWLARPETLALLRRYVAEQSPVQAHARLRLAQALYAQGPRNRAEALALLSAESSSAASFLRARIELEGGEADARMRAVTTLSRFAANGESGEEARALLRAEARRQLAANPTPEQREEAIRMLAAAAWGLEWAAMAELMAAVRDANGGRPPATASAEAAEALRHRLAPYISADDYPAVAMRADEQGIVRLRALIGPSGRILFTEPVIAGPEQPWTLVTAVRRLYVARPLRPVDLGPNLPTPYMWIALPDIHFRIDDQACAASHFDGERLRRTAQFSGRM